MAGRALLQAAELSPETETGLIVAFVVTAFIMLLLGGYAAFLTGRVNKLEARLYQVEDHPKLRKGVLDVE